jgi:hypothetical protein
MGKIQQSNKEAKKQPVLSLKEKRAVKKSKKNNKDAIQPFITTR